ncbi:hypothetical protein D3C73_1459070 [compost metagenome]
MRFRREVDDYVNALAEQRIHRLHIGDVGFDKCIIGIAFNRFQIFQIPRIRQRIHIDDLVLRMLLQHVYYKIAADKAGSAGD